MSISGFPAGSFRIDELAPPPIESAPAESAPAEAPAARPPVAPPPGGLADRNTVMARLATASAPRVDPARVEADVDALYEAMKGLGTDEEKLFEILENRNADERQAIQTRFMEKYADEWPTLRNALKSELSGAEEKRALKALDEGTTMAQRGEILHDMGQGGGVGRAIRHFGTWFTFGLGSDEVRNDGIPRLTGADIRRDMLPHLKPGDTILCGNAGGVSHAIMYIGDGKIIHSMASKETMRTMGERVLDTLKAPVDMALEAMGKKDSKQGVIIEGVEEFFDRFERDTFVVMRSPHMTPERAQAGIEHIKTLIGKDYDWDFAPANGSYYCTEVVGEFYRKALGDEAPRIGARAHEIPVLLSREAIVDPLDVLESPDLVPVAHSKSAEKKFGERLQGSIAGEK